MASGNTLAIFTPRDNEPPATNYATLNLSATALHPTLDFDTTTQEAAVFTRVMPRHYSGGGITVYVCWAIAATTGTVGWTVEFERVNTVITSDSYASAQTITAATVSGSTLVPSITNVAVTDGANIDSIAVGDTFRVRLKRDVSNDTAAGDAFFLSMELKET